MVSGATDATYTVTVNVIPEPADGDYRLVYVYAEDQAGNAITDGTFEISQMSYPKTIGTGATEVRVVLGSSTKVNLSALGYAGFTILRGAKVDLTLRPADSQPINKIKMTVPAQATVNWESLTS